MVSPNKNFSDDEFQRIQQEIERQAEAEEKKEQEEDINTFVEPPPEKEIPKPPSVKIYESDDLSGKKVSISIPNQEEEKERFPAPTPPPSPNTPPKEENFFTKFKNRFFKTK